MYRGQKGTGLRQGLVKGSLKRWYVTRSLRTSVLGRGREGREHLPIKDYERLTGVIRDTRLCCGQGACRAFSGTGRNLPLLLITS